MTRSDIYLISRVLKQNCSDSLLELVARHEKLFYSISNKYCSSSQSLQLEIKEHMLQIFFDSIKSYNPTKGSKFSTWLGNQVRFFCLNLKNKKNALIPVENDFLNSLIHNNFISSSGLNMLELTSQVQEILEEIKDENIKKVIKYRYFNDSGKVLNYQQIANKMSITAQTALNWHNKFIRLAKKKLTKAKI